MGWIVAFVIGAIYLLYEALRPKKYRGGSSPNSGAGVAVKPVTPAPSRGGMAVLDWPTIED